MRADSPPAAGGRPTRAGRCARLATAVALGAVIAGAPATAGAAAAHRRTGPRYVSGRVDVAGYTVVVVGYNGRTASSRSQRFRIAAPDARVTLALVGARGVFAGPVVLGGGDARVITGLRAPANVGTIYVVAAKGYGHLARGIARRSLDSSRWAYARHGVPIGNGLNLGLVVSRSRGGGSGPGQDSAHVGIPNELDVAIPGTRVLRALAPPSAAELASVTPSTGGTPVARDSSGEVPGGASAPPPGGTPASGPPPASTPASAPPPAGPPPAGSPPAAPSAGSPWMSQLFLAMNESLNDDAAGVTRTQIDAMLKARLNVKLLNVPASAALLELDCNGLSFCSQGGSGQAQLEGLPISNTGTFASARFPAGALDQATGLGEVVGPAAPQGLLGNTGGGREFSLAPSATSAQIGSGDVITEVLGEGAAATQIPTTIDFVFNTVPAIAAYADSAGDSAAISYPDSSNAGTFANPLKVAAGANGDVVVTFKVYRPQRRGVAGAGEPAFMDVGHLGYAVDSASVGSPGAGAGGAPQCPASTYSNPSPTLALAGGGGEHGPPSGAGELVDSADDAPAGAAHTISFTVDLTQCLTAKGMSSFPVGQPVQFDISANSQSSSDHANQTFVVQRTG